MQHEQAEAGGGGGGRQQSDAQGWAGIHERVCGGGL
uniref:Uncharacterized protein n=1 Tax=Picea sitchensis TaxID=3332 RepID=A9NR09_PICSI|nr:unknown [Picea sitchensis]